MKPAIGATKPSANFRGKKGKMILGHFADNFLCSLFNIFTPSTFCFLSSGFQNVNITFCSPYKLQVFLHGFELASLPHKDYSKVDPI